MKPYIKNDQELTDFFNSLPENYDDDDYAHRVYDIRSFVKSFISPSMTRGDDLVKLIHDMLLKYTKTEYAKIVLRNKNVAVMT